MQNEVEKLIGPSNDRQIRKPALEPEKADATPNVTIPSNKHQIGNKLLEEVRAYRDRTCPLLVVKKKETKT